MPRTEKPTDPTLTAAEPADPERRASPRGVPIGAVPPTVDPAPLLAWRDLGDEARRQVSTLRSAGQDFARAARALVRMPVHAARLLRQAVRPAGA